MLRAAPGRSRCNVADDWQFLKEFAPRIAYANPLVPINVERIRDPRSKDLNPSAPDAGAQWDKQPEGELKVVLGESGMIRADVANGEQTIPLGSLTGAQIYESLLDVAK